LKQRTPIACCSSNYIAGSIRSQGDHDHPAQDPAALASCRFSPLLALEISQSGRATANQADLRALIRRMSVENVLWGAPRIHGELLKLGFAVAQSTVAKYMAKNGDPSAQNWGTFLRNHALHIAAMDLFVVPTVSFNLLHGLIIVRLARRELVWINVTAHPTAEWIAQQITEAFPWNEAPRCLIRDRDGICGVAVTRRLRAMGIGHKPHCAGLAVAERHRGTADRNKCVPCCRIGRAAFAAKF
jgi:hypothetical protein